MSTELELITEHLRAGRLDQAKALVQLVLAARPDDIESHLAACKVGLAEGDFDRTIERLEDLMVDFPGMPQPLVLLAECMLQKGEQTQALALARKAISWGADSAFVHWLLGHESLDQEDYGVALDCFDRAIALFSEHPDGWLGKGRALIGLERLADAEDALIQAVQCAPENVQAWVELIQLELDAGVDDIAAENLALALRTHPGHPLLLQFAQENRPIDTDDFSAGLDSLVQAVYDEDEARINDVMDVLVSSHFDHERLILAKGEYYLATSEGTIIELIHALNRYIRQEIQDWWAKVVLGRLLLRESPLQNLPMAVAHCEDAWRISGENPHAAIGLIEAWASTGKLVYAKALCEKIAKGERRESARARAILEGK